MSNIIKLGSILTIVTLVAAYVLAEIYSVTKPKIEIQKLAKTKNALEFVLPEAKLIEPVTKKVPVKDSKGNILYNKNEVLYYKGFADSTKLKLVGYAFKAIGNGYTSGTPVETIVGMDTSAKITQIKIIFQKETPGLGARCEESGDFHGKNWSTKQFTGKQVGDLKVDKDGGSIVSITGATITSRAITNSIREKIQSLQGEIKTK